MKLQRNGNLIVACTEITIIQSCICYVFNIVSSVEVWLEIDIKRIESKTSERAREGESVVVRIIYTFTHYQVLSGQGTERERERKRAKEEQGGGVEQSCIFREEIRLKTR